MSPGPMPVTNALTMGHAAVANAPIRWNAVPIMLNPAMIVVGVMRAKRLPTAFAAAVMPARIAMPAGAAPSSAAVIASTERVNACMPGMCEKSMPAMRLNPAFAMLLSAPVRV